VFNEVVPTNTYEVIQFLEIRNVMTISNDFKIYELEVDKEELSETEEKALLDCLNKNNVEHKEFLKIQATPEEKEKIIKIYEDSIKQDEEILQDKKASFKRIMDNLEGDIETKTDTTFQENLKQIKRRS
jgi:hypothetical protein